MPFSNIRNQPMYFVTGDPETENNPTLEYPGQIGARCTITEPLRGSPQTTGQSRMKTYQCVQTDSTMTTAPFSGAVAFWSDKTKYLVTTARAKLGAGRIAGVFRFAVTPGNFCFIQTQGPCVNVYIQPTPTQPPDATGLFVVPSVTVDGAANCLTAGTAPTYPVLGYSSSVMIGGSSQCEVDLDVPETP
jgi:hypothetical protein